MLGNSSQHPELGHCTREWALNSSFHWFIRESWRGKGGLLTRAGSAPRPAFRAGTPRGPSTWACSRILAPWAVTWTALGSPQTWSPGPHGALMWAWCRTCGWQAKAGGGLRRRVPPPAPPQPLGSSRECLGGPGSPLSGAPFSSLLSCRRLDFPGRSRVGPGWARSAPRGPPATLRHTACVGLGAARPAA